jgi:hypothetical protein
METEFAFDDALTMAATVGPEDLCRGDYVAVLNRTYEAPSFLWCCEAAGVSPDEPVRIRYRTREGGRPLKVKGVCLPFVFVKTPTGRWRSIDIRQVELVRLDRDYGRLVWKTLREQCKRRSQAAVSDVSA